MRDRPRAGARGAPLSRPLVHLFDAHVYVFRAYFAMPEMHAPDGTPTNAAYGFASTLIRYLSDPAPSHLACCFDFALTSFRNELFPAYKSSRGEEAPPDLEPQFDLCREAAEALGVRVFEVEGYEADDVIATLSDALVSQRADVRVVSSDKDLSQLVREDGRVHLYDLQRERRLDADGVRQHFGVSPAQIPDWLALVGDKVDDLPGVPRFGKKSASAALARFGSLDAMPEDAEAWAELPVRGGARLAESLARHREQALRIRELATVVRRVPGVAASPADLAWRGADADRFEALCRRLGWGRIATRVPRFA